MDPGILSNNFHLKLYEKNEEIHSQFLVVLDVYFFGQGQLYF